MTGDFNIRNNDWDSSYPHHSTYVDVLWEVADSLNLELSTPINYQILFTPGGESLQSWLGNI